MSDTTIEIHLTNRQEARILQKALTAYTICMEHSDQTKGEDYGIAKSWLERINAVDWDEKH